MYKQSVNLPKIFQVNEGILGQVPQFLARNAIDFNNILVVSGETVSCGYAETIVRSFKNAKEFMIGRNDSEPVEHLLEFCKTNGTDLIIGVGGGYILDIVKRASLIGDMENILVPTIISNDGLISPISVIKHTTGKTLSLPGKMPIGIVVDIDIIRKAPAKFLQAAAGDILSNLSATNDWILAYEQTGEPINDLAYMLSRSAALALTHHESKDILNRSFLKQVVNCQINSGLAMALAGTSRPCSGSEHLISHAIDYKNISEDTLHGLQVGSISIFCLFLQKKLDAKCLNYAYELNIPLAFHTLNSQISPNIGTIYNEALLMRPGRYTILNTLSQTGFEDAYSDYLTFLERFRI